jgi:hypothetical protein
MRRPMLKPHRRAPNATPEKDAWVTTTDEIPAAELELDRLAWNLPAPRSEESGQRRPWPPWPVKPIRDQDQRQPDVSKPDE